MAKKVIQILTDDLDGGKADESIRFALDGVNFEIDLSHANAARMRQAFEPFVFAARKEISARKSSSISASRQGQQDRDRNAMIRAWAKARGIPLNDRGRIPAEIIAAWMAASPAERRGEIPGQMEITPVPAETQTEAAPVAQVADVAQVPESSPEPAQTEPVSTPEAEQAPKPAKTAPRKRATPAKGTAPTPAPTKETHAKKAAKAQPAKAQPARTAGSTRKPAKTAPPALFSADGS